MKPRLLTILICGLLLAPAQLSWARKWADNTGKFSVEAELVDIKNDKVVLRKTSGGVITLPVARLSGADRNYLKTVAKLPKDNRPQELLAFPDALTNPPTWNDANVPFDLGAFFRAPPAEENAAPLYLAAFIEFSKAEMMALFPTLPEQERREWYRAAQELSEEERRLEDAWEKDPQSVDNVAVDAWLANYNVGFEKLAAAQRRPKCVFQTGLSFHSLLPHNQAARQVARVVEWRTRRDLQRRELDRPIQDLKTLLRLSRDLQARAPAVAHLVSVAVDYRCCELVRMILNAPGIDARKCDRLIVLLAEHESKTMDRLLEANRTEYVVSRQTLHDLQHRTGSFDPQSMNKLWGISGDVTSPLACIKIFTDLGGYNPQKTAILTARLEESLLPGAWQGGKMLSDENYAKEVEALNRFFASILALAKQPEFLRQGAGEIKAAEAPLRETTLAGFFIPPESALLQAFCRNEARLRGTQCLVALARWQLEHADAPRDLETVIKAAGLSSVPIDPWSGQPLRMALVAGKPAIYSVGPDGKDDEAQVEWKVTTDAPGDFIFRLETTPQ